MIMSRNNVRYKCTRKNDYLQNYIAVYIERVSSVSYRNLRRRHHLPKYIFVIAKNAKLTALEIFLPTIIN